MSSNTLPSREEKDQAVYAAYLADGYITPEGRASLHMRWLIVL